MKGRRKKYLFRVTLTGFLAVLALGLFTFSGAADEIVADFSADRVENLPGKEIRFADESTGTVTAWHWDFGDGGTSTEKNPTHVYTKIGYYTVTLKVTGPGGSDTVQKKEFIRISEDCTC